MFHRLLSLLFPPRCVLCKAFLTKEETDYCHNCRKNAPVFEKSNFKLSFLAGWTAVWYYKDMVRGSLLRYKFAGRRNYACAYGRSLGMKLQKQGLEFDILTFVPTATLRKLHRGYDQSELLANAVGNELGVTPEKTLKKRHNNPPQSGIKDIAQRRANVLGVYQAVNPEQLQNKRILLLDDIITTGATASECARVLLTAGAKEVYCAAVAVSNHNTK